MLALNGRIQRCWTPSHKLHYSLAFTMGSVAFSVEMYTLSGSQRA